MLKACPKFVQYRLSLGLKLWRGDPTESRGMIFQTESN